MNRFPNSPYPPGHPFSQIAGIRSQMRSGASSVVADPPKPVIEMSFLVTLFEHPEGEVIRLVKPVWNKLLAEIARNPNLLLEISDRKFEELVAGAYEEAGFDEVVLTHRSGDLGRDVIATRKGFGCIRVVDQAKQYAPDRKVPAKDVRELYGVVCRDQNASKGILTTTSDFAPGIAEEFKDAIPYRIELVNGPQLQNRLNSLVEE